MTEIPIHNPQEPVVCAGCEGHDHTQHAVTVELEDGSHAACPCRGECDGSLVWPPREPVAIGMVR